MTTTYVAYAGDAATQFDRGHWINVHVPLVREAWGPHGLQSVAGFFPSGDGGGPVAVCLRVFRDGAAMEAALASPDTERVMADVKKVTAVEPRRSRAVPV